jgi:hypothetical protein
MKRLGLALIIVALMLVISAPTALAGGPCQQEICPGACQAVVTTGCIY